LSFLKYIELDEKEPKHKLSTFSTDHKNYDDAGVILNNKIVVVDFDAYNEIGELIFNDVPTLKVNTNRGFHLWYKKPKADNINTPIRNYTNKLTVSGAKVDYKTGTRQYAIVKQDGLMRDMENEHLLDKLDELPELPLLLYPSKLKHDIYDLKDGEGRNSSMYSHLLSTLEQYSLDDETLNNLAKFINTHIFNKPLPDDELQNTIESVKNKKPAPTKQKYLDPKNMIMTSEVLAERLDIHYFRNRLYFKQDGYYVSDNNLLLRAIDNLIQLMPNQHKQLLDLFRIKARLQENDELPIQFKNGYALYENELVEVDPGFTPYYIDIDYREDAYDEHVDKFLDWFTCNRKDLRVFIEDILGHILMTKGFPHRAFFFWGESGSNGKSTLIKMLESFVGTSYSNVPLDKFDDDTMTSGLIGKILNIADDIDASYLDKSSNFKTIVSGDPVSLRPIYEQPIKLVSKATLVFTCNNIPVFKDKSGGIKRRMRVIPCDARVTERDINLDAKLSSDNAKSYLLNLALAGLERILKNNDLSKCKPVDDITREYFVQSDSVLAFLEEHDIDGVVKASAYRMYVAYCEENGLTAVAHKSFGSRLVSEGYGEKQIRKDGKRPRVYTR